MQSIKKQPKYPNQYATASINCLDCFMNILRTRLFKPVVSDRYIARPRLMQIMNDGRNKPVQKVIAAAGYGKSIFVSQWLDETGSRHCWISIEEDCNDLLTLLKYLIEAVRTIDQTPLLELGHLGNSLELPENTELAVPVLNSLQRIKEEIIFVLDDYHNVHNQLVHNFFTGLLNHFPEQHRIILISRYDPPIDLRRLNAYAKVHEIRMADLKFTEEEIMALSEQQTGKKLSPDAATAICNQTEGWVIPIRLWLKGLALATDVETLEHVGNQMQETRILGDLLEDVFTSLDASVRKYIMLASLFPRFNLALLRGIHDSIHPEGDQSFDEIEIRISKLLDRSLFIMALDDDNTWYRFHQLVKAFLKNRCNKKFSGDTISKSIGFGCSYLAAENSILEAIQLSLEYKDFSRAIDLFNRDRYSIFDIQSFDQFRQLLKLFPGEVIETEPSLLLIRAVLFDLTKKDDQMSVDLDRARYLLPPLSSASEEAKRLWGEYYSSCTSLLFRNQKMGEVIQYSQNAMELIRTSSSYLHDHAMAFYILALNASGKSDQARAFLDSYKKTLKTTDPSYHMNYFTLAALFGFMQGKLEDIIENALKARSLAMNHRNQGILLMANYYISIALYQRNELDRGLKYLREAIESSHLTRPTWIIECFYLECLHHLARGEDTNCDHCFKEMLAFQKQFRSSSFKQLNSFLETELLLRKGDASLAWESWRGRPKKPTSYNYHYFQSQLTEVKLLIADHPYQDLNRAEDLLEYCEEYATQVNNLNLLLQANALKIVLYALKNETDKALKHLKSLLSRTKAESIIRVYTDCGSPMQNLISQISDVSRKDPHVLEILRSFNTKSRTRKEGLLREKPLIKQRASEITQKEIQILQLISEGYQNKEIAEELYYSLGTVKTYIYNLYQKIGVKNRGQAIAYYRALEEASAAIIK